jgi:hypothetical protein
MVNIAPPATALRPFIRCYAHVDARVLAAAAVQPVPARTTQVLEFTFGDPYTVQFAHDQPHMVRDFWRLSSSKPTNFAPEDGLFNMFLEPGEAGPEAQIRHPGSVAHGGPRQSCA